VGSVREVIDSLEVHFLGNTDPNIGFALLGDLKGAAEEHTPTDAAVLEAARCGIDELNQHYAVDGRGPFHLFVRSRTFNHDEDVWMGWERKRGALTEMTRLLRGSTDTSITLQAGDATFLPGVTFVITLDADTVLPRDSARKMVCSIAHPLSRARVDADSSLVSGGYGLVQPRVGMTLPSATATLYAMLHTGPGWTPMRERSRTRTRMSSVRGRSPARESTRSASSTPCWKAASPTTACSRTT
jgi:cyclic beta-1,2-glucan synthetase